MIAESSGAPALTRSADETGPALAARVDAMADLVWCRVRQRDLLDRLYKEGTTLKPINRELHNARVDALRIFDQRIAELEAARL